MAQIFQDVFGRKLVKENLVEKAILYFSYSYV